jgi:hypothetical protein
MLRKKNLSDGEALNLLAGYINAGMVEQGSQQTGQGAASRGYGEIAQIYCFVNYHTVTALLTY